MLTNLQRAQLIFLRMTFSAMSVLPYAVGAGAMTSQAIEICTSHRHATPVCVLGEAARRGIATITPSCHAR